MQCWLMPDIFPLNAGRTTSGADVKRYVKAVLDGFLAILAAFGWIVAIAFFAMLQGDTIAGIRINRSPWLLVPLGLIFAIGFFVALRATYSRISN
jgi:hypothetical protein